MTSFLSGCGGELPVAASVTGLVVDSDFNPLFGVTVSIGGKVATSQSDGSYTFSSISNGVYVVTLSLSGYTTSYRRIEVAGASTYVPIAILTPLDGKTTSIGSGGGIASNTDGSIKLTVPSGVLGATEDISLTKVEVSSAPYPPPIGYQFIAVIVYVSPNDVDLGSGRATLSIPNLTGLADGTSVPFYHFSPSAAEWQLIPDANGAASVTTGTITAEVSLFGWSAAIVQYSPNAGNVTGVVRNAFTSDSIPYAYVWHSSFSTVCDQFGAYTLSNIPTGEATVEAIATGFNRGFTSVVVPTGGTVTGDISLTPVSTGTIIGNIYDAYTTAGIIGARVRAEPSGRETTTDDSGDYAFYNVPNGTVSIYAFADGYLSNNDSGYLGEGETLVRDIGLVPTTAATEWTDNFETDKGWGKTTEHISCGWQRKNNPQTIQDSLHPTYVTLPDSGNLPSPKEGNYCYWFGVTLEGTSPEGSYVGVQKSGDVADSGGETSAVTPQVDVGGSLTSPVIDLTSFAYANLSFWTWWETECVNIATGFDKMSIEISTDSPGFGTWQTIGVLNPTQDPDPTLRSPEIPYSSGGFNQLGAWVKHIYNLTPYVGNLVKIRFTFDAVDRQYNGFRGWFIDDLKVSPSQVGGSGISATAVEKRPDRGVIQALPR
jgi:hypothetical protein